ncbi:synaptojanin-2-binding protein [Tachysurus fulvidraco]|uniref:synaptojanin-2-binding protein n=1 Tax=Tachysurus fulvidraco TaxID=1234273 RepID=UPI001FEDE630|nr:synaptojanin-2-binding protein [Tachysurus fulvidraco]
MNGLTHSSHSALEIQLRRGPAGLGFNIVGGVDQQYVMNDSGIYVAKIKEDGAAALDGRLQEGDKIRAINGHKLENLSHSAAVEMFRSAGEEVTLHIQQRRSHSSNGPLGSRPDGDSSSSMSSLALLGVFLTAAAITAFIFYRRPGAFRRQTPF